jgi:hypothetical protein
MSSGYGFVGTLPTSIYCASSTSKNDAGTCFQYGVNNDDTLLTSYCTNNWQLDPNYTAQKYAFNCALYRDVIVEESELLNPTLLFLTDGSSSQYVSTSPWFALDLGKQRHIIGIVLKVGTINPDSLGDFTVKIYNDKIDAVTLSGSIAPGKTSTAGVWTQNIDKIAQYVYVKSNLKIPLNVIEIEVLELPDGRKDPKCICFQPTVPGVIPVCGDPVCMSNGAKTAAMRALKCPATTIYNCSQYVNLGPEAQANILKDVNFAQQCGNQILAPPPTPVVPPEETNYWPYIIVVLITVVAIALFLSARLRTTSSELRSVIASQAAFSATPRTAPSGA